MGSMTDAPVFLTARQVVDRYGGNITLGALANWRFKKSGPPYVKIGGRVLYPLDDLVRWEDSQKRTSEK